MFYHRIKPENPHCLQIMIALFRLVSMRRRERKFLLSSSLFISHNSWNMWTAIWGCEWDVWMTGEEEGKETTKTPTTLSPALTSRRH